jgi:hypothetical protein
MIVNAHAIVDTVSQGIRHAAHLAISAQFFTLIKFTAEIGAELVETEPVTIERNVAVELF